MGDMVEQKLATMNSFQFFGRSFSTHPSHDILNKHNIKETDSKVTIWGTFDMSKGEDSGGGYIIRKYYVMKTSI